MTLLEWTLPVAGTVLAGLTVGVVKTYQSNSKKIIKTEDRVKAAEDKIKDMESELTETRKETHRRIDGVSASNKEDHKNLFEQLRKVGESVAKIEGYLMGKHEKE